MTAPPPGELPDDALERARRRATRLLAGIAARELLDDTGLAGASTTTIVLGSALGASLLAWLMVRSSRRTGLVTGLLVAVVGFGALGLLGLLLLLAVGLAAILRRRVSPLPAAS